jgi:hypothetical protein
MSLCVVCGARSRGDLHCAQCAHTNTKEYNVNARRLLCTHIYNPLSAGDLFFPLIEKSRSRFTFTSFWNLLFRAEREPLVSQVCGAHLFLSMYTCELTFSFFCQTRCGGGQKSCETRCSPWPRFGQGLLGGWFLLFFVPSKIGSFWSRKNSPCFCDTKYLSALTRDAKKDKSPSTEIFSCVPIKRFSRAPFWLPHRRMPLKCEFPLGAHTLYIMCSSMRCERAFIAARCPRTSLSDCQQGITWSEITKLAVSVLWVSFKIMMHLSDEDDDGLLGTS